MRLAAAFTIAAGCLLAAPLRAQPAQPEVGRRCDTAPNTPGCPGAASPGATPDTAKRAPGSGEMQTSPTGMTTDSAKQPSPPQPTSQPPKSQP
jgi:hypothetical protein